ncbi:MAG: aminotransferase class III-fold pyridoxal phosphate-dependent enzyme, partial [Betaproteobacteria bacterium]|nr:aminotransferase class III-fold pyridoxal phosphate-dependent enzyme [Betaproteobacteria bacterium]
WFGYQQVGVSPDIATLAKGLGSGVPIGACLAGGRAAGLFGQGNHGSTFGGNPLVCAAALTTIQVMEEEGLLDNAARIGALIRQLFAEALAGVKGVREIRGRGLMIGIELDRPCGELVGKALAAGLLINVTADCVVRLLPSLIFGDGDARELVARTAPLIKEFLAA